MENITIIGAGSFGTALGFVLATKGHQVTMWARRPEIAAEINKKKTNHNYLENASLPENLKATDSIESALQDSSIVLFAVPSTFFKDILTQCLPHLKDQKLVHVIKGMDHSSGQLISEVIESQTKLPYAVLSGPNHAEEMVKNLPTAATIASEDKETANFLADTFNTPHFKVYAHDDVKGVELCGILKNIIALAIGVCDGLNLGHNAKGSIITLALQEMAMIIEFYGAKKATVNGLAGVGDLIATCFSPHSRNRFVGEQFAKGKTMEQIQQDMHGMIAEGVLNTKVVYELCAKQGIEPPIVTQAYNVLYEKQDLRKAIESLLTTV